MKDSSEVSCSGQDSNFCRKDLTSEVHWDIQRPLAYFCCKSVNWFLYVPINFWNQLLSWNTTYFLTNFFVIFPHLNWPMDKIFLQKISVSHKYLKIYGEIHQAWVNRGEVTRGGIQLGGRGKVSAPRHIHILMKIIIILIKIHVTVKPFAPPFST